MSYSHFKNKGSTSTLQKDNNRVSDYVCIFINNYIYNTGKTTLYKTKIDLPIDSQTVYNRVIG